jgi:hypothetical protein
MITLIGKITFYIIPANMLFLFLFRDLDILGVMFDNLQNILIQKKSYANY